MELPDKVEHVSAPVSDAFIVVCEKCGLKLSSAEDNMARQIQKELKGMCRDAFGKKVVRPVVSSCLDICPKDQIAFGLIWQNEKKENQFFTIHPTHPEKDAKAIFQTLVNNKG